MNLQNTEAKNRLVGIYEKAINNKFSLEEKILIAKEAGYDFMEFSVDESDERLNRINWSDEQIKEVQELLVKHRFNFNSMTLSGHRKYPFGSKNPETRKKAMDIMEKAIILAKKLGIRTVQLAGYDVYYEQGDDETRQFFIEGIKKAVRLASKYSVCLAFEIMDTRFMGTNTRALTYINMIDSPYLQIYPDLGNIYQWANKTDLYNEFEIVKNHLVAFHFKDTVPGKFRDTPFGSGTVDFPYMLNILKKLELNQPIMIEMWSLNKAEETKDEAVKYIADAYEFYNKQWELVGGDN
ncbi:L-ribulose-5-phosphate 3-epimerase [Mycoplasmopsis bovis]|uniref:L-ribulose-5-phosphate 3-epimerase n=3 Tax=Mycoplasmopsis bovis TaxID=28903 RepID=A0A2N8U397_MYCBV|nr:L-ribulose-5-phosphate 3-epimerase [Mycoplasmopsis bovis]ADR24767.1 putative hexulose-6-phosphate isomerase [Mycoplasmopsis bovis PG45]AEI90392.1 L-xylulose 5-phosphate 3-epimerase [Mycoplasmopsis bovis Hubei-1]AFM52068.1 L-ribulose-5-phosphate 3-epimerase [Mycoplasmopsis bovis HB0801]AIA34249.1 L-xylulose 5-phosphate 3-epimerase [Mycoplasmopsis bovis CQ-W70]AKO50857.1 ribulose-phosphate 3-epimerase [Mycoplasmopsis bovis]